MKTAQHKTNHENDVRVIALRAQLSRGQNIDFSRKLNKLPLGEAIQWAEELVQLMIKLGYSHTKVRLI
jgi:hypothetical protein